MLSSIGPKYLVNVFSFFCAVPPVPPFVGLSFMIIGIVIVIIQIWDDVGKLQARDYLQIQEDVRELKKLVKNSTK